MFRLVSPLGGLSIGSRSGGTSFTPTQISGMVGWYDFSDVTTLFTESTRTTPVTADADLIGGVTDKSGQSNHLTSADAARPVYKVNIQNGRSISRNAAGDSYQFTTGITPAPCTFILVLTPSGTAGARSIYFGPDGSSLGYRINDSTNKQNLDKAGVANMGVSTTGLSAGTFYLGGFTYANPDVTFHLNGSTDGTASSAQTFAGTQTYLCSAPAGFEFVGDIGEVFIYNSVISAENMTSLKAYINTKWALY